ncbi:hypothetical protein [Cognatilysobacter bugurensis]|uniref:Uncharacterized protein n=1 Tax=Cognatilysobacter bugurensis TaxID=543356 RepID=A0A918SYQ2_9GAMM|nr:hypothetical protein [Lysobacter bugurensis]GHA78900.1 hypothetical protein GCM10007067_15400 [Lysobacter bugurensis]
MAELWHYLSITLPVALAVWALIEWWQRRKRVPQVRLEPTLDEPRRGPQAECPHPRFKPVYVLRDGAYVATEEMQCVQCRQKMKA